MYLKQLTETMKYETITSLDFESYRCVCGIDGKSASKSQVECVYKNYKEYCSRRRQRLFLKKVGSLKSVRKIKFTLFEEEGLGNALMCPIFFGNRNTGVSVEPLLTQPFVQFLVMHKAVEQIVLDKYSSLKSKSIELYGR